MPNTLDAAPITGVKEINNREGGYNVPTPEMISTYEPGDKRLDASIAVAEGVGPVGAFIVESVKSVVGYAPAADKTGKPFIKKYWNKSGGLTGNTGDNWPYYRYADVLLMLAEALNEQGKGSEALPYLNMVRQRAALAAVAETGQGALREIILHERRVELAFENKRWLDLVRTGKAVEVMSAHGQFIKANYPNVPANAYNLTAGRLVFPIPDREVKINDLLIQNDGY
jgi:hypothetical protein